MALTDQNKSLPGVGDIVAKSSAAIGDFKTSAMAGQKVQDFLKADIERLQKQEGELLAKFGGMNKLKERIEKFKKDARNFSGKNLGLTTTWAYQTANEASLKQLQSDFENYIVKEFQNNLPADINKSITAKELFQYLNLQDYGLDNMEAIVTERGSTLKRRKGGQVGSARFESTKLNNYLVRAASPAIRKRINDAIDYIKKQYKISGQSLPVQINTSNNTITIRLGEEWQKLTSSKKGEGLTASEAKKDPYITKNLGKINGQLIEALLKNLSLSDSEPTFRKVIKQMLSQNPYLFFVGKNVNQITGLVGEICAMILFYDLVGHYPSVEWAAQNTGLTGTQDSADIIIEEGYGIQVKNSTQDFEDLRAEGKNLEIGFSEVSFETLGAKLHFDYQPIENLYDTVQYNKEYEWERADGHSNFMLGSNANFSSMADELTRLQREFENIMMIYSSALLYMANTRTSNNPTFYSGDLGNVLYMVNLVPYLASDMLQKILDALNNIESNPIKFSTGFHALDKTIVDDINSQHAHPFFSNAGTEINTSDKRKLYFKTSYSFR